MVSYRGLGANKSFFSKKEHRADIEREEWTVLKIQKNELGCDGDNVGKY